MTDTDFTAAVDLPKLQSWLPLLQESLVREGCFHWQLTGQSMAPTLPDGCEIEIVTATAQDLSPGAVLVFAVGSALVAHRLIHRSGRYLVTQGDGLRKSDRWLLPQQVVGRVRRATVGHVQVWPGKHEALARWRWVARAFALAGGRRLHRLITRPEKQAGT